MRVSEWSEKINALRLRICAFTGSCVMMIIVEKPFLFVRGVKRVGFAYIHWKWGIHDTLSTSNYLNVCERSAEKNILFDFPAQN